MLGEVGNVLYFDLNIGENYLSDWNASLALREIIANALDEQGDNNIKVELVKDGTIIIRDWGGGLKPEHLIYQEFGKRNRDDKIGKFGVGLKDAIGVLRAKDIKVEIKSSGYEFDFHMKEKSVGSSYKTLHACIKTIENDEFVGTEFRIYNFPSADFEEAKQQFIIFQDIRILFTSSKGQIIDKDINDIAGIYLNGMKIAEDKKLRFSYNITNPSNKIKNGINRERKNVSRSVYQSDIAKILEKVDKEVVLDILVDQLNRTFDNKNFSEITWKDVIIKTCNYVIKNQNTVFVSNDNIEKNTEAYNLITQNRKVKVFKVSPDVKHIIEENLMLFGNTRLFLEHFVAEFEQTISIDRLTEDEKNNLSKVIELFKNISVLKGEYYLLDNIWISKENSSYTDNSKGVIVIPRECLKSVELCSSKLINALSSIRYGSSQFKDYIIGELCSEFIELRNKEFKVRNESFIKIVEK